MEYWTSLAQQIDKPRLLLLLDEASSVPPKVRDLFYSTIRSMDSARTMARPNPHLSRYGFVFAGVFEPERLVRDQLNSPFNVSRIFHLPDFSVREVEALIWVHPRPAEAASPEEVAEAVHGWTGGHPYLAQWLGELVERRGAPAADLQSVVSAEAASLTDLARDNIGPMISVSFEEAADRALLQRILAGERVTFSRANRSVARLELSGALQRASGDVCRVRNRIYETALRRALGMAEPEKARRVFISYSSQDSAFVQRLTQDLERADIGIWIDRRQLAVGDSIVEGVARGLAESSDLVVVLSQASRESRWVQTELNAGLMQALSGKDIRVLPVLIADVPPPVLVSHLAFADFRRDYQQGLRELLDALRASRAAASPDADTQATSRTMAPAPNRPELRRLMTRHLNESEVRALWFDTLGERMPEPHPPSSLSDLVVRLLEETRSRQLTEELLQNLRAERPDLAL